MLSPQQVSEHLNVSLSLVYKIINDGSLPCYRINSVIRVSEEQLQQYLDGSKAEPVRRLPKSTRRHF